MSKGRDKRLTFSQSFFAGGVAGLAARTATSPLDVVKTIIQVGSRSSATVFGAEQAAALASDVAKAGRFRKGPRLTILGTTRHLYQHDGLRAFWRGNLVACLRVFPYSALQFSVFSRLKGSFQPAINEVLNGSEGSMQQSSKLASSLDALIAGALAGIVSSTLTYPLDMLKTRMTLAAFAKHEGRQHGLIATSKELIQKEGISKLYRGIVPTILGVVPFAGGMFAAYEFLGKVIGNTDISPAQSFLQGLVASAFAQTISFPFDTVRKLLHAQGSTILCPSVQADVQFSSMRGAFSALLKERGVLSLWRGLFPNLVRVAPYSGTAFMVFEASKKWIVYHNGYTVSPFHDTPREGIPQNITPEELEKLTKTS